MSGKCPHCETILTTAKADKVEIQSGRARFLGVSFACPSCSSVLSVQVDPIALQADLISELKKEIQKWAGR
jgi:RNase P subunit RPR2